MDNLVSVGVMSVSEQGIRRTAIMEENSKNSFLNRITKKREEIIRLKRERGIPNDTCLCGRKIEPERLQLNLVTCKECAFNGESCKY